MEPLLTMGSCRIIGGGVLRSEMIRAVISKSWMNFGTTRSKRAMLGSLDLAEKNAKKREETQ